MKVRGGLLRLRHEKRLGFPTAVSALRLECGPSLRHRGFGCTPYRAETPGLRPYLNKRSVGAEALRYFALTPVPERGAGATRIQLMSRLQSIYEVGG